MPEITKVIGPPGAGKTHFLMERVELACDRYIPKEIGVVSYTVAAVSEAKDRIRQKLNVTWDKIPNVRTIHSHCFSLLGIKKEDVMETAKNIRDFNEDYPAFAISGGGKSEDGQREFEGNNDIFQQMQILRSKIIPTKEWPIECQHFGNAWFEHMGNEGKTDFNGMLEQCLDRELSPDIKILMVDEAQDLPALQTALIRQWGKCCDEVFWVGDSNQALFRFAGADPNNFINLEAGKVIELKQSYRLSPAILHKSMEIIRQANVKEIVDFKPTDKYGPGQILNVQKPDLSLPGTHMILCRCKFQVQKYINILRKANIPFCNQYRQEDKAWNPLTLSGAESIKVFLKIRRLEKINIYEIKQLIKNCKAKTTMRRGTKKKIESMPLTEKKEYDLLELLSIGFLGTFIDKHEPLNYYFNIKSDASDLIYYLAENNPKQFLETPRICVGTGHSVKGGSCDHVWIDTGITTKIKKAMASDPDAWDDECRTAYVMCSRARKTIGFINSSGYRNPFLR